MNRPNYYLFISFYNFFSIGEKLLYSVVLVFIVQQCQSVIIYEISPGCSLEGLMLKLKLQYFGHLM